jgi:hypothetical protein
MVCGSGFPAANRFNAGSSDRGWPRQVGMRAKAAPTWHTFSTNAMCFFLHLSLSFLNPKIEILNVYRAIVPWDDGGPKSKMVI